jgi:stearoyl-CoA desaturase (Delta-9 desaturase)
MPASASTHPVGPTCVSESRQVGDPVTGASLALSRTVSMLLVAGPVVALVCVFVPLWGHVIQLRDVLLAVAFYLVTAFGITVGYHRLFTHRSFTANRVLKLVLAGAGAMALEGAPIGWVANHRRHHMFSDHAGDPHTPHGFGAGARDQLRGFLHAHCGWIFSPDFTPADRFARDLLADRDLVTMNRLFPVFAVLSLGVPFALGWAMSGTLAGAASALIWAGLLRMALLHHVTWSVNSVCHTFGKRPFTTKDRSTNFAPLALLSLGDSWHNFHHAHPGAARHGALRYQIDPSALLIRAFERLGWATRVRWPTAAQLA